MKLLKPRSLVFDSTYDEKHNFTMYDSNDKYYKKIKDNWHRISDIPIETLYEIANGIYKKRS